MKQFKRTLAIMLVLCLSISFIACSRKPQNDENVEKDETTETQKLTSNDALTTGEEPENSETAKTDETISVIETPEFPAVDLLSSFVEKFISFSGADGFGKLSMSFKGEEGVIASEGSASITCVGNYENYFTVSNGMESIPARIDVSKTEALTSGETITFSISYYEPEKANSLGFFVTPFTVKVPELGKYITNKNQITDSLLADMLDIRTWIKHSHLDDITDNDREYLDGALVHRAFFADLKTDSGWTLDATPALLVLTRNGRYNSEYRMMLLYNIKTFTDGTWGANSDFVSVKIGGYTYNNESYFSHNNLYYYLQNNLKNQWTLDEIISIPVQPIESDGRIQVEVLEEVAENITFKGSENEGTVISPIFPEDGTVFLTVPHNDGDLYFIVASKIWNRISVVQNNKCLAVFEWGVSREEGLSTGDKITVGLWLTGMSEIDSFDELPFQFVPSVITVPELGKIITNIKNLPVKDKLVDALGATYESGMGNSIPTGAKILKIQQLILKPQYTLDGKYKNNYSLLIYYEHEGYYYGVWCFDMMSYSDGRIRPKYYEVIESDTLFTSTKFQSIEALENKIFDSWNNSINREKYDITTLYE